MTQFRRVDPNPMDSQLDQLRTDLIFPETPDITSALARTDITHLPASIAATSPRLRSLSWQPLMAAAMMIAILALVIPGTRSTLASWFGLPGIRIEMGTDEQAPSDPPASIGGTLLLGRQVSKEEAAAVARFDILAPMGGRISRVPETYLLQRDGAVMVSLLYPASENLPEIGKTGVGLLLMQIDSPESTAIITKRSMNDQAPVSVRVNEVQGWWIAGGALTVEPVYETGTFERSSGNVLIWEQGGVTYRMESALAMPDALALAERLQPLPTVVPGDLIEMEPSGIAPCKRG